MSVRQLTQGIASLRQSSSISGRDIEALRKAAGPVVSASEKSLLDKFVSEKFSNFTPDAFSAFEEEFGVPANPQATELVHVSTHRLRVPEASGIASFPDGRFLVVDDQRGVMASYPDGKIRMLGAALRDSRLSELEGLCLSSDHTYAYAVSEKTSEILVLSIDDNGGTLSLEGTEVLGELPKIGHSENKGWEGIDILPGHFSPTGGDCLVAVHEGHPRRVGIFSLPELDEVELLTPSDFALSHLADISDVAVHPKTGHLFLLSDASRSVVEVALKNKLTAGPGGLLESPQLCTLSVHKLPLDKSYKPEGLTFTGDDTLWVACDGDNELLEMKIR